MKQVWTTLTSTDAERTEHVGAALGRLLEFGTTVAVYGQLGTGKTVLARGIARGLGVRETVTSPTFAVVQEYDCGDGRWFYHLDMYRIHDANDALSFGIEDYLFAPCAVTVVEWPERIDGLLYTNGAPNRGCADPRLVPVLIEHAGQDKRTIRLPRTVADRLAL